ncbi:MAG: hypothetical protein NVS9B2_21780 [Steroidobacteraceae bacterium]
MRSVFRVLLVLWAGSLWSLAAWVAPTLFHVQRDPRLAGLVAARLFGIETYVGIGGAALAAELPERANVTWGYAAAALLAIDEWALKPVLAMAHARGAASGLSFAAWHGISAVLYVAACLAVVVLIARQSIK